MNIGKIITDKRKSLGLTQQALAEKLNISFQAVSKWENGTSYPDVTILPLLAANLKVSIDSLLPPPSMTNDIIWRAIIGACHPTIFVMRLCASSLRPRHIKCLI